MHIVERSADPVCVPREAFEAKLRPGNSCCEDPCLTLLDGVVYLFYPAFDGYTPRVAYSTLSLSAFLAQRWADWSIPCVVTPPGIDDKDACLLPARIGGRYVIFHRAGNCIRINRSERLNFGAGYWIDNRSDCIRPRKAYWDNLKFGIAAPPIPVRRGNHGRSDLSVLRRSRQCGLRRAHAAGRGAPAHGPLTGRGRHYGRRRSLGAASRTSPFRHGVVRHLKSVVAALPAFLQRRHVERRRARGQRIEA